MTFSRAARRYAQALMDVAEDKKIIDRLVADMELIRSTAQESREFRAFLKNPVIKKDKKRAVLTAVFQQSVDAATMDFLMLLCDKGREDLLPQIIEQFFALRDEKLGLVSVEVKAATEMTDEQQAILRQRFEQLTKKKVRIRMSIDKHLKGGFLAKVGDTVFDGSVRHQLELLRKRFVEGPVQN
jgi:F-type H+-transporting ATPase subunit delta